MPQKVKFKMTHVDGFTTVTATAFIYGTETDPKLEYDYRYDNMSWGGSMTEKQAIERGVIKSKKK